MTATTEGNIKNLEAIMLDFRATVNEYAARDELDSEELIAALHGLIRRLRILEKNIDEQIIQDHLS